MSLNLEILNEDVTKKHGFLQFLIRENIEKAYKLN